MDQEIPQTDAIFDFIDPGAGYNDADHGELEAWIIPRIIGPGTDFTSSVGLANGYPEPQPNLYRQNEPSQTYLDPSSGQFWPSGVHAHASNVSMTHSPEVGYFRKVICKSFLILTPTRDTSDSKKFFSCVDWRTTAHQLPIQPCKSVSSQRPGR
jgi:hypothetical protein